MTDLSGIAAGTRESIGRYFSLVSAVPSAVLVAWTTMLVGSRAWTGPPDPAGAVGVFAAGGIGGGIGLVLAAIALGVLLHPLQYAFVQFLEGYWGTGHLARHVARIRTAAHWRRVEEIRLQHRETMQKIELLNRQRQLPGAEKSSIRARIDLLAADATELGRTTAEYPLTRQQFMPTRLGNALRHHERTAGAAYELDAVIAMPFLISVATPADVEYLDDQRSQLDLAARMTIVSLVATVLTIVFLAHHGLWLLLALAPYGGTYISYRGTVVAAAEYGRAMGVVLTLNRFALYERLELERPDETHAERAQNRIVTDFLGGRVSPEDTLAYRPRRPKDRGESV